MTNILLVSNGHAEDLAAAGIGENIRKTAPAINIKALPLVGLGKAYDKKGIINLSLGKLLPSGGFAKEGLRHFLKDLKAGLLGSFLKQIKILRVEGKKADLLICMGDVFLVAFCGIFARKPIFFIDGPNSVRIRDYYPIEKWILKRFCKKVIVQDQETADFLIKNKIPGAYLGTWVMDYVPLTGNDFGIDQNKTVIGILPGTRKEAYTNILLIFEVFKAMARENKELIGLVAFALDRLELQKRLATTQWNYQEAKIDEKAKGITAKITGPSGTSLLLVEGRFGNVCKAAKLIIGLAGIANEQAVGLGTPVVAFLGKGPQTTLRRWKEIYNITGDSMAILQGSAAEIAKQALDILNDPERLTKMGQIGIESKKDQGAIDKIAQLIVGNLL